jgi:hypothetical protein
MLDVVAVGTFNVHCRPIVDTIDGVGRKPKRVVNLLKAAQIAFAEMGDVDGMEAKPLVTGCFFDSGWNSDRCGAICVVGHLLSQGLVAVGPPWRAVHFSNDDQLALVVVFVSSMRLRMHRTISEF